MRVRKQVAAKTALNAKNHEALGAERLAELLIETRIPRMVPHFAVQWS